MGFNANVLKMDKFGNVKDFTFILSTKNYKHLDQLNNVKRETIDFKANLNSANELSFEVYKEVNGEIEKLWKDIIDLKSVYVPELNEYFEIEVTYDDKLDEVKTVVGKSLCECELSQAIIHGTEINTQTDSDRVDYVQTTFYNGENPKGSLLHRILSFVPHYSIKHVDASLCNLQRSFSIDGTSVYDFLTGECAEQFNCLFVFDSTDRTVSVYDLYTTCYECGHRGAYNFVCPECGSKNVSYFGQDTEIYVNKENLTDDIKFQTDVGSIKNCFRLRSGDDDMDAAIISMNPNGTPYIYYITPEQRADMSTELVNKMDSYDALVEEYTPEYQELAQDIRDLEDEKTYYEYTMMPTPIEDDVEVPEGSISKTEIVNLTVANLSPLGMEEMSSATSKDTTDSVVKNYARVFVNTSLVKIDVATSTFEYKGKDAEGWDYGIWTGKLKLTAYSNANDIAITDTLTLTIHDNYGDFLQQKVMKDMALNDEEGSIFDVLAIEDLDDFKEALKEYCLSRLNSFRLALDTACTTLVSLDQATDDADWYEDIYVPYHNRLLACGDEIIVRESQIKEIQDQLDVLYARKSEIQSILNFEDYLGNELYLEFCTYRREGEYHNENYISDGLSNAEIIDHARDFIETAKKELIRSATAQHSISANLYNLMVMSEFKPLLNKFALGNFIRVRVGKELYRLRLISYHLNFSDLSTIDVEFSDMTRDENVVSETQKILSDAQSMSSNFSYISKQAEKGEKANESVSNIAQEGLNSALAQIKNNVNEETLIDNNGYLGRQLDDVTGKYSPEQLRITHNNIVFTETNWASASCALGKHKYTFYDSENKTFKTNIGYGLSSKFVQSGYVYGSQIIGGDIYSENYSSTKGTHLALNDGSFNFGHKIIYDAPTDKLTMKGVNIEWSSSTTPEISDIDGLDDELGSKVAQTDFDNTIKNYSTTEQVNAKINVSKTEINIEMNKQITETKEYADGAASTAQTNAINNTTEKLKSYSTTTQMNSAINQKADAINLSVTQQITETKTYASNAASTAQSNAIADTTEKLKSYSTTTQMNSAIDLKADAITSKVNAVEKNLTDNYSTTTQMNSAITQSANSITSEVSTKYETKDNASTKYTSLQSQITQNANNINLKVSTDDLVNQINIGTEAIELTGNRVIINSDNFKLSADGTIEAKNGTFSGAITGGSININNKFKVDEQGNVTLPSGTKLSWTDVTNQPTIPTNTNQLTNGAGYTTMTAVEGKGYQTASQVTTITENTIKTTNVEATNLVVQAAKIKGTITASQINTTGLIAENISGTTISGKTISGGTISGSTITIGSGFSVTNTGVMTCTGATVSGKIHLKTGSSIGGWETDSNSIFKGSWDSSTNLVFMCTGTTGTVTLAGKSLYSQYGNEGWVFGAAPNFGVTRSGEMYCKSGEIGNWKFSESCLEGKSSSGQYFVRIYPSGKIFGSYTYYFAIFSNGGGGAPIGGITSSGWK